MAVGAQVGEDDAPEPVFVVRLDVIVGAHVRHRLRRAQNHRAQCLLGERGGVHAALQTLVAAEADAQLAGFANAFKHADLTIAQLHHQRRAPAAQALVIEHRELHAQTGLTRHVPNHFFDAAFAVHRSQAHAFRGDVEAIVAGDLEHRFQPR